MSLVSLVATSQFISFVSDGRVSDEGTVIQENYKKITKVNNKIIFSMTGNYNASKVINDNVGLYSNDDAQSFAKDLFDNLGKGKINRPVQILVGGLNQSGNIYYSGFDEGSNELVEVHPVLHDVKFACTHSDEAQRYQPMNLLSNLIELRIGSYQEITIENIQQVQREFNKEISKNDKSVNDQVFMEYISK